MFPKFGNRHKYNVKQACIDAGFELPDVFHKLSNDAITAIWNGIGAARSKLNELIPKSILWLNIELPSCPHDIAYQFGQTEADKKRADKAFKKNLYIWIDKHSAFKWLARLRKKIAYGYYVAVRDFGDDAFWENKKVDK